MKKHDQPNQRVQLQFMVVPELLAAQAYVPDAVRRRKPQAVIRHNPASWRACRPPKNTPEGQEYYRQSEAHGKAMADLWTGTVGRAGHCGHGGCSVFLWDSCTTSIIRHWTPAVHDR